MAEDISIEEELNARLAGVPFVSFVIIMTSGDRFKIGDRDEVAVGASTITIYYPRSGAIVLRKSQLLGLEMP